MSRVIQDSDDELDDDLEADAYRPENEDVTPKQSTSDASSTGECEKHHLVTICLSVLNRSSTEADRSSPSSASAVSDSCERHPKVVYS